MFPLHVLDAIATIYALESRWRHFAAHIVPPQSAETSHASVAGQHNSTLPPSMYCGELNIEVRCEPHDVVWYGHTRIAEADPSP